jgi:CNT family concentrative nucleoside transporter
MDKLLGLAGIALILLIAFLLSSNKRAIRLRVVAAAFALQAGIAVLVLYTPWGRRAIEGMAQGVSNLLGYANKGTEFLFGPAANNPLAQTFALGALPVIIFFAALVAILYYLGIMQRVVRWVGGAIGWVTGISRVESLGSAANIFVGQSESPLVVRPYLATLTPPQLFTLMVVGMAGVAGTILAAYAVLLGNQALPYLLAAAFMSAPGGILMAKIMMPDEPRTDELPLEDGKPAEEKSMSPKPSKRASSRPTSSWPPPRARRPASSSPSPSARWCSPSSPSLRSPMACSAASAAGSAILSSASSRSSATSSSRSCS